MHSVFAQAVNNSCNQKVDSRIGWCHIWWFCRWIWNDVTLVTSVIITSLPVDLLLELSLTVYFKRVYSAPW